MLERTNNEPRGPYYDGRTHFSYNNDLVFRPHHFKAHKTVQDMVRRAERSMDENKWEG